MQITALGLAVG